MKRLLCKIGLHNWRENLERIPDCSFIYYIRTCTVCGKKQALTPDTIFGVTIKKEKDEKRN